MIERSKILIVDDAPTNLKILEIRLAKDYDLKGASSGEEALEAIQTFKPAVILLDIMMPGIDGYEVTRRIRKMPELSLTKIILVSSKAMIDDKLEGYRAGADDYITKPFNGEELKAKLDHCTKMYRLENQMREINISLEEQVRIRSEQLIQSERQAYVGRHASDVVHNLKNPMAISQFYLGQLKNEFPDHPAIAKIEKACDKMLLFIKDVLIANDLSSSEIKEQNINEIVKEELEFLKINNDLKHNLLSEAVLESQTLVAISQSHAHQLLGNLIKNSSEALFGMKDGKITVRTEDRNQRVLITVEDNGPGISPENLNRVFDSLFTTKTGENGGPTGTGIGLPYCKKMVETYGGSIEVTSTVGIGTKVTIELPAAVA